MSGIIFITGMPGSGKTGWGRKVAEQYNFHFFDLDIYIESKEEKTITQIFKEHGEAGFRKREKEALKEIIAGNPKPFVLSCGGGTTVDRENYDLMNENGCIIYLQAEVRTLVNNLQEKIMDRPLLANAVNVTERLQELYDQRKDIYEQADYILDAENLSVEDFKPIVERCTGQH